MYYTTCVCLRAMSFVLVPRRLFFIPTASTTFAHLLKLRPLVPPPSPPLPPPPPPSISTMCSEAGLSLLVVIETSEYEKRMKTFILSMHPNDLMGTFYVACDAFNFPALRVLLWINYVFVASHQLVRALLEAARGGRTKEVIALLDQGADIEATDWVRDVLHFKSSYIHTWACLPTLEMRG